MLGRKTKFEPPPCPRCGTGAVRAEGSIGYDDDRIYKEHLRCQCLTCNYQFEAYRARPNPHYPAKWRIVQAETPMVDDEENMMVMHPMALSHQETDLSAPSCNTSSSSSSSSSSSRVNSSQTYASSKQPPPYSGPVSEHKTTSTLQCENCKQFLSDVVLYYTCQHCNVMWQLENWTDLQKRDLFCEGCKHPNNSKHRTAICGGCNFVCEFNVLGQIKNEYSRQQMPSNIIMINKERCRHKNTRPWKGENDMIRLFCEDCQTLLFDECPS